MNLAFGALVFLFIFLPGIIFRATLINSDSLENPLDSNIIGELIWITIPATILHIFTIPILGLSYDIRIDQIYLLLVGSNVTTDLNFSVIKTSWPLFLIYIGSLSTISWGLANFLKRLIISKRWDQQFRFAKITNEWDNLFSGRIENEEVLPDYASIDVIMEAGGDTYIYTGVLEQYFLSKNNGLDKIFLKNVYRRKLELDIYGKQKEDEVKTENTRDSDERYYSMPGDRFVVSYEKVINLNISFHYIQNP